jgi:N-acetylmuramoyl-L-alanine amidase
VKKIPRILLDLLIEVPTAVIVIAVFLVWLFLAAGAQSRELPPNQLDCLARAIYWEARGEPAAGQVAVARVVLNRTNHAEFPSTPCAVISQRTNGRCQFSWFCTSRRHARPRNGEAWDQARFVAQVASLDRSARGDALYFHAKRMRVRWRHLTEVAEIGEHVFYGDRNARR